jgi:hypothetical protein
MIQKREIAAIIFATANATRKRIATSLVTAQARGNTKTIMTAN